MANTFELISSVTVGSGGAASIDFTSIPSTYTDLVLKVSLRSNRSATQDSFKVVPNGATTGLSVRYLWADGTSPASSTDTSILGAYGVDGNTATANTFSNGDIYIPNYAGSNQKSMSIDAVNENNATDARMSLDAGLWTGTSVITSISLVPLVGPNFIQYSTAYLYGVKNV